MYDRLLKEMEALTALEKKLLCLFLDLPLPDRHIVYQQLCVSEIRREDCVSSYFLDFAIKKPVPSLKTSYRVPVWVDLCSDLEIISSDCKKIECFKKTGTLHLLEEPENTKTRYLTKNDGQNIGVNLHFIKGVVCELEVVNWSGYRIDYDMLWKNLENGKKVFRYDDMDYYNAVISNRQFDS